MEFPELLDPVEEHGLGCFESRSVARRERVWQSVLLSVSFHLALFSTFVLIPKSSSNVGTPWIEVRLVAFMDGSAGAEYGEGGPSGDEPSMASPPVEGPPPKQEFKEKPREKEPKPVAKQAVMRSRSTAGPKEPAAQSPVRSNTSPVDPLLPSGSQSEDPAPGAPTGNTDSSQGLAEPGSGGSGSDGGPHRRGGHGGGTVDAEFGAANGPRFAHKSLPKYPHLARQLGKEAVVVLRVTIDEQGRPIAVEAVKSAGSGFDEEAIRAVKESLFHPAKRDGKAVMCRAVLPIRFQLKGSD